MSDQRGLPVERACTIYPRPPHEVPHPRRDGSENDATATSPHCTPGEPVRIFPGEPTTWGLDAGHASLGPGSTARPGPYLVTASRLSTSRMGRMGNIYNKHARIELERGGPSRFPSTRSPAPSVPHQLLPPAPACPSAPGSDISSKFE